MRVMYVDDEREHLDRFTETVKKLEGIQEVYLFTDGREALDFIRDHRVDAAFLDIHMPEMNGIALAGAMGKIRPDLPVVFLTAHASYALQAFEVNAVGYILKPYTPEQIQGMIRKIGDRCQPEEERFVYFQTMPRFEVFVNGRLLPISQRKVKEYLALLVDFAGCSVTSQQAITYLWEDRPDDDTTKALLRMTAKRLRDILVREKIDFILIEEKGVRAVQTGRVSCDYYQILNGDERAMEKYQGEYMVEYSWAEVTNARIAKMVSQYRKNQI